MADEPEEEPYDGAAVELEEDVYNGEAGHAQKHNAVNKQANWLTQQWAQRGEDDVLAASIDSALVPVSPRPQSLVLLGHSIVGQNGPGIYNTSWNTAADLSENAFGFWSYTNPALDGRFRMLRNSGVQGETVAQIYSRLTSTCLGLAEVPGYVLVMATRNDIWAGGASTSTINTALGVLGQMYDAILAKGCILIAATETRSGSDTGAQGDRLRQVNNWIKNYAATHGNTILLDWEMALSYTADGQGGAPDPAYVNDAGTQNAHPSPAGAARMAKYLVDALTSHTGGVAFDRVTSTADPRCLTANPNMSGTGGTPLAGIGGAVADGYTVGFTGGSGGVTATATASKVARTDGRVGEWQRVVINSLPADNNYLTFERTGISGLNSRWTTGTPVEVVLEYEFLARPTQLTRMWVESAFGGSSYQGGVWREFNGQLAAAGALADFPMRGVLRTPVFAAPSPSSSGHRLCVGGVADIKIGHFALRLASPDRLPI